LAILQDDLVRKRNLTRDKAIAEFELSQVEFQARLQEQQIATAHAEIELRKARARKVNFGVPRLKG